MPDFWCIWGFHDEGVLAYFDEEKFKGAGNRTFKACSSDLRYLKIKINKK